MSIYVSIYLARLHKNFLDPVVLLVAVSISWAFSTPYKGANKALIVASLEEDLWDLIFLEGRYSDIYSAGGLECLCTQQMPIEDSPIRLDCTH